MQPNMIKIRRHFKAPVIEHIEFAIQEELSKIEIRSRIKPGMRIAITAVSRGIANIARIITGVVTELKRHGAEPFIVPAMGSHGGATAEGQIARITEKTLVVGADIAKKIHVARAVDFRGIELGKDCVFQNDQEGLTKLASWMKELGRVHEKTDIVFGIEPTGHYWFPLAAFLKGQGIKIVIVNPHHVNKSKELEDNSQTKSDYKDAKDIAGAGAMIDIGCYSLDLVLNALDYPKPLTVSAYTSNHFGTNPNYHHQALQFDVEDFGAAFIRFEGGLVLDFKMSYNS